MRSSPAAIVGTPTCGRLTRFRWGPIREHLPTNRICFGFFELSGEHVEAIWDLVPEP